MLEMLPLHEEAAPHSKYVSTEEIQIESLDNKFHELAAADGCIWLKIDTQGYEISVLEGAALSLPKIKCVQLEVSFAPLYKGAAKFEDILRIMRKNGYIIVNVEPGFCNNETGQLLQTDFTFMRA